MANILGQIDIHGPGSVSASGGKGGGGEATYKFNLSLDSSLSRPFENTWHPMAPSITRPDTEDSCYRGDPRPQSRATPQPYSPEYERANPAPPPRRVPVVSVPRFSRMCRKRDDTF